MAFVTPTDFSAGVLATEANLDNLSDNLTTGVFRPLAETTLGAPAASVTFSSIPATFRNLYLTMLARCTAATAAVNVVAQFNGDGAAANYHSEYLTAGAAAVGAAEFAPSALGGIFVAQIPGASAGSSIMYGGFEMRIHDYLSAREKPLISTGDSRTGGAGAHAAWIIGGVWINAAAITSIVLSPASNSFTAGSRFTLYGEPLPA